MTGRERFLPTALRVSAGALLWGAHFAVVYGFAAFACVRGDPRAIPWVVAAATLAAAALALAIVMRERARRTEPMAWLAAGVGAFALFAIVAEGAAAIGAGGCR